MGNLKKVSSFTPNFKVEPKICNKTIKTKLAQFRKIRINPEKEKDGEITVELLGKSKDEEREVD